MGGTRLKAFPDQVGAPTNRSLRNRRSRRVISESRHNKRLFTPEIKRFLKSWLVRRRKNPYPSRSEKKDLAFQTGLTYIQICNWFANWRRKLKNSSRGREHTWCNLIKGYNATARGNVEQFSICSEDSIWNDSACYSVDEDRGEGGDVCEGGDAVEEGDVAVQDHSYVSTEVRGVRPGLGWGKPSLLSRWLQSAATYRPQAAPWPAHQSWLALPALRHREELDAAEALTSLSACGSWAQPPAPSLVQPIN